MAIHYSKISTHWNYYLAIEQDLMKISRFIEFCEENEKTYSIELAHILLAATSEVDVLLKEICKPLGTDNDAGIQDYRKALQKSEELWSKNFLRERVIIPRYNMILNPWENWQNGGIHVPNWWSANNKVKHHRSTNYNLANLQNALNAVAGLLLVNLFSIQPTKDWPDETRPELEAPKLLEPSSGIWLFL